MTAGEKDGLEKGPLTTPHGSLYRGLEDGVGATFSAAPGRDLPAVLGWPGEVLEAGLGFRELCAVEPVEMEMGGENVPAEALSIFRKACGAEEGFTACGYQEIWYLGAESSPAVQLCHRGANGACATSCSGIIVLEANSREGNIP